MGMNDYMLNVVQMTRLVLPVIQRHGHGTIEFMVSDSSSYVTGQNVHVVGGMTAWV
ncbi:MAG: hypothetical protein AB8B64_26800 [Granulosicoccus sp.]